MTSLRRSLAASGLAAYLALLAAPASADGTGWVDHLQRQQWDRMIWQRAQGQLSAYEWRALTESQARIDRYQRAANRDGQLDPRERGRLASMLDRQSRAIYNQSHD
jgi:hypothetical protein